MTAPERGKGLRVDFDGMEETLSLDTDDDGLPELEEEFPILSLDELAALSDEEIDVSDIPELDESFFDLAPIPESGAAKAEEGLSDAPG